MDKYGAGARPDVAASDGKIPNRDARLRAGAAH